MFFSFLFLFLELQETHTHRLVKDMYMSMRRCDARLQAVPNPYYLIANNSTFQISFKYCRYYFYCYMRGIILSMDYTYLYGTIVVVIVWQLDLQLPMHSVSITTKVVSSNPVHGKVYSLQHQVIKFVSDLQHIGGFLQVLRFPPSVKLTATI